MLIFNRLNKQINCFSYVMQMRCGVCIYCTRNKKIFFILYWHDVTYSWVSSQILWIRIVLVHVRTCMASSKCVVVLFSNTNRRVLFAHTCITIIYMLAELVKICSGAACFWQPGLITTLCNRSSWINNALYSNLFLWGITIRFAIAPTPELKN